MLFLLTGYVAVGQSFSALPGTVLHQEVLPGEAGECFIYFENPAGDSLQLQWKNIESSFPDEWTIDLCDFGACYVGIPSSGLMQPAIGSEKAYLKLIVQPGQTPGQAWLWFRVWTTGNPDDKMDVFFSLTTPGITATTTPGTPTIHLYPNPTIGPLWIENPSTDATPVRLIQADGQVIRHIEVGPGDRHHIDISGFPAGVYFLQTNTATQTVLRTN